MYAGGPSGKIVGALTINSGGTVNADENWGLGYANGTCVSGITINGGALNFYANVNGQGGTSASNITMTGGTISGVPFDWYQGITTTPTLTTVASTATAVISAGVNLRLGNAGNLTFNVASGSTGGADLLVSGPIVAGYQLPTSGIIMNGPGRCNSPARTPTPATRWSAAARSASAAR